MTLNADEPNRDSSVDERSAGSNSHGREDQHIDTEYRQREGRLTSSRRGKSE